MIRALSSYLTWASASPDQNAWNNVPSTFADFISHLRNGRLWGPKASNGPCNPHWIPQTTYCHMNEVTYQELKAEDRPQWMEPYLTSIDPTYWQVAQSLHPQKADQPNN